MPRKKATPPPDRLVSPAEAAALTGVCTKTLRRYVAAGRLKAHRFGPRLLRYDRDELAALIADVPSGRAS